MRFPFRRTWDAELQPGGGQRTGPGPSPRPALSGTSRDLGDQQGRGLQYPANVSAHPNVVLPGRRLLDRGERIEALATIVVAQPSAVRQVDHQGRVRFGHYL